MDVHQYPLSHPEIFGTNEDFKRTRKCHVAMQAFANCEAPEKCRVKPDEIQSYTQALNRVLDRNNLCKDKAAIRLAHFIAEETRRRELAGNTELIDRAKQLANQHDAGTPYGSSCRC